MSGIASQAIANIQNYQQRIAALLLYQDVLKGDVGEAFVHLLAVLCEGDRDVCLVAYGAWFHALARSQCSWPDYLVSQILYAENAFATQAQTAPLLDLPPALVAAARQDLRTLQMLYDCSPESLSQWLQTICQVPDAPIGWTAPPIPLPVTFPLLADWGDGLDELATYYQRQGTGLYGRYRMLRWHGDHLVGISRPDPIRLAQLAGYDQPKASLIQNTEFLLAGYAALHVLLYGSRGSGKSSLVKALVNEYGDRGLRLIEVAKTDLHALPKIVEPLGRVSQKFIIFVDDLSFEEDDDAFKALKVVLEGGVTARPANVVVYATSNRRHLIREYFSDRPAPRDGDDIQAWDTVQEKLSFSDRFGLTLTFEPADQPTYLEIVKHLAQEVAIALPETELEYRALQWATRHNGRSGRTARQFIDFLQAELALNG